MLDQGKTSYRFESDEMSKTPLLLIAAGVSLLLLLALVGGKKARESRSRLGASTFKSHPHEPIQHDHEHVHVTHNRTEAERGVGGWEHLTAVHSHSHNHAGLEHSHRPHRNFAREHRAEAHIHDHEHPTTP